jgi:anti-sigma B factor antagonist
MSGPSDPLRPGAGCTAEAVGDVLVYRLSGDLDMGAQDTLAFDKALAAFHAVVVDLTQVTFFTSTALNALLGLRLRAEPLSMPVHLAGLPPAAARILEMTDATDLFHLHGSLEAALAAVHSPPR